MTDTAKVEERLWKAIDEAPRTGMLGVSGGQPRHMQPMTAFRDEGETTLWFFTRNDTTLAKDVGLGHTAMLCVISKDRELYACLGGELSPDRDQTRIDRYWNPMVAAWYPNGKDDPQLTLLRFDLEDAEVWLSDDGPVKIAFEVAKANLTKTTPDMGDRAHLNFQ